MLEARHAERLAYTRSQAAQALGVSRSTFIRRVLPYLDTIEMPWGAKLIPVDELERLILERRRACPEARAERRPAGRPPAVSPEVIERIHTQRAAGRSLSKIAADLNNAGTPTVSGGSQWWPSTIRAILVRSAR